MSDKVKLNDESGDKKYFTIIPNYILNHSTLYDREVYIQMKRIAGDDSTCWTSQTKLAKQCGVSINRLKISIKYLVEHGWIKFVGKKPVGTKGGLQQVNEYKIIDLWQINNDFYQKQKGVSNNDIPLKGVSQDEPKGCHENAKGVSPDDDKEEPINNIPIKEDSKAVALQVVSFIDLFKPININYDKWYKNTTQRKAIENLIEKIGSERLEKVIKILPQTNKLSYVTTVTTPYQLLNDFSKLEAQMLRLKSSKNKKTSISI